MSAAAPSPENGPLPVPDPTDLSGPPNWLLRAPNLDVPHGFATRLGGVSDGPFASLNLGLSSGDAPERVEANRDRVLRAFGVDRAEVTAFDQIHGDRVLDARASWFEEQADAAVSASPRAFLVVSVADCFPLLFHDPVRGVIGAAHCGWRGTVMGLAGKVVSAMVTRHGSLPTDVRVAIGPGIRGACYQVGSEVAERFGLAGFPAEVARREAEALEESAQASAPGPSNAETGRAAAGRPAHAGDRYRLDLAAANRWCLREAGVPDANVVDLALCTHCEPERFFSHRRDAGVTGRHWAVIGMSG